MIGTRVDPDDGRHLLVVALLVRSLELYRASLLLIEQSMFNPARIMERCLMEAVFTIRAIARDEELYERYVMEDEIQRKKLINKARMSASPTLSELKGATGDELLEEIKATIEAHEIKGLRTSDLAKAAGLEDSYLSGYAILSGTVHSKVRDMGQYVFLGEDGVVKDGHAEFPRNEPVARLNIAGVMLLNVLGAFVEFFAIDVGDLLDEYEQFFQVVLEEGAE